MRKIRLELDRLEVATFDPAPAAGADGRGTVRAHATGGQYTCVYHCTWNHVTCNGEAGCPVVTERFTACGC